VGFLVWKNAIWQPWSFRWGQFFGGRDWPTLWTVEWPSLELLDKKDRGSNLANQLAECRVYFFRGERTRNILI
jgi:hypothetical protein